MNLIHCPCVKCGNILKFGARIIRDHLYCNGVDTSYHTWIWHGEPNMLDVDANKPFVGTTEQGYVSEIVDMQDNGFGDFSNDPCEFLNVIGDGDEPLYPGCKFSKLGALVRLYNLKAKHGLSDVGFTEHLIFLTELLPEGNQLPCSLYEAKKFLRALGMDYEKIHACPNNCIFYRKEFDQVTNCPKCSLSRWKTDKNVHVREGVPAKVLWYFPPIPRFKRMFKSSRAAESLTWHANNKMSDGHMRHPSDSPSWKLVYDKWSEFGKDPRNLRLALSADGINPHASLSSRYSCWPVIMIIYNLSPWLCMKRKFMMLTLLISGPKQAGNDINVYLEPLIDDLKCLWKGVPGVYDAFRGEYFMLKAQLMWTVNDFPAYGNLSGCVVKGYKACPICGDDTPSHRLTHGNKVCYIGHRRFLPQDHSFRKQRVTFNGEQEFRPPHVSLTGEEVFRKVDGLTHTVDDKDNRPC